jgi:hypothetical protein
MYNLTKEELKILKPLNTPKKIQDFIDKIPINFEPEGDTCISPRRVLKENRAHCIEAAMLAALALRIHDHKPLIVDMTSTRDDDDHVIAVFKQNDYWGAISKSNHGVLRYREPIYKSIRELVMSYFHEYINNKNSKKTLRSFSNPVDLSRFDKQNWVTSEEDVWFIPEYLTKIKHNKILSKKQAYNLRKADHMELRIGEITEWNK